MQEDASEYRHRVVNAVMKAIFDASLVELDGNLRDGHLVLRVEGGGMWRLDAGLFASIRAHRLLGKRVVVTGTRDGFDLIAVRRLRRAP